MTSFAVPSAIEGTKAVLSQGIRDVSRKGTFVYGHRKGVVGSGVHVESRLGLGGAESVRSWGGG